MGDVYIAADSLLGRQVAIKVFPAEFGRDAERLARFVREAKAASALNHPNILTVFDAGTKSGMYFIVTELVDGLTLREWIKRDRPSLSELAGAVRQAAIALEAAHRAGIVHRDIKPENLMRRDDGLVKVLDFGVAKMIGTADGAAPPDDSVPLTGAGMLVGTARYMSPEQASGEPVDGRTDIWSLGVVLYELAAGRPPFVKNNVMATVVDIMSREPDPLAGLVPHAPEALLQVVDRALRKERKDRFQSAGEMAEALAELASGAMNAAAEAYTPSPAGHASVASTVLQPLDRSSRVAVPGAPTSEGGAAQYFGKRLDPLSTNIGPHRSGLIGRRRELVDVTSALRSQAGDRLVTLTGPGGTGKTRLAVEAGRELQNGPDFPDGVFFVDLSPLPEASLIVPAVARALDVAEPPGASLHDALLRDVAAKRLLIVLDNFEHVLEGAMFVSDLLTASPGLKVLATSRAPLRLSFERDYPVEPLEVPAATTLPPLDELAGVPAVALFVARARLAKSSFELTPENARAVSEICRRLEGLPLALELAAARVKLLTPAAMLDRLHDRLQLLTGGPRDLPGRQRTMRGAIEWSYDLLGESERPVFRRLAVFPAGCTLEAAEAVCGPLGEDVLDALSSLIDNSLVKQREQKDGQARFTMLEVVRAYAGELLDASGEVAEVRLAFARYFKKMAEKADADIRSANQVAAVRRLSQERANLHSALAIMMDVEPREGAAFISNMQSYWAAQGYSDTERMMWLTKALTLGDPPPPLRARLLNGLARCHVRMGRLEEAVKLGREAVEVARDSEALDVLSITLGGLGHSLSVVGDLAGARAAFEESARIATGRGSTHSLSVALGSLGEVTRIGGDLEAAIGYYEKALDVAGRQNRSNPIGIILANLGGVSLEQGNFEAAANYYRKSLAVLSELENLLWASTALDGIAAAALHAGDAEKAALLAGAAEGLSVARGFHLEEWEQSLRDRYVTELRSRLDPDTLERQSSRGRTMTLTEATAAALGK